MTILRKFSNRIHFTRTKRDEESPLNQLYYAELERHTSDIAAFHLDRLVIQALCGECF